MIRRLFLLGLFLSAVAAAYFFDLHRFLDLETLRANREWLVDQVTANPVRSAAIFVIVYAVTVALSVPGAIVMTLAGGFMFGTWIGGLLVVVGATIGAVAVFLAARTVLGDMLKQKAGPWLGRMERGFKEDGWSYLLILRLVPIFPFWLVNLVPAFLGVGIGLFTLTTFIGIMPGSFVYASVGNGLGEIFAAGGEPDLSLFTDPAVLGPILGLALLASIPPMYKRIRGRSQLSN